MQSDHTITAGNPHPGLVNNQPLLLMGGQLTMVRVVWLILATLCTSLFLTALPVHYRQLLDKCVGIQCVYYQLSPNAMFALQSAGITPGFYAAYITALTVATTLAYIGIAFFLFFRRSNEWMALLASLWLVTFGTMNETTLALAYSQPVLEPLVVLLDQLGWAILLPLFLFTFPNGRFVPHWTLWIYIVYITSGLVGILTNLVNTNQGNSNSTFIWVVWFTTQLMGVVSQIYRYRRDSNPTQRQQTKWMVTSLVTTVLILALHSIFNPPAHLAKLVEITVLSVAFLVVPLSLGFSILRYHLWDIDLIINRALIWGTLSGMVLGSYVLVVGLLGSLFQSYGSFIPSLIATALIAVIFHPFRQRVQRGINRLMYGERDEPYRVLSRLGRRLEATLATESILSTIVETVAHTLKLPYVAITLKEGHVFRLTTAVGDPINSPLVFPLTYQGETNGQLICGPRAEGEPFNAEEVRLLEDIASQAGVALHAVRLNTDLQRSRQRLVLAREEERRRIRRDLHDGLGPLLASQTLKIGSARSLIEREPETARKMLEQIEQENTVALNDIRHLVYNLRPPALDELGLLRAVQQDASRHPGLEVTFDVPDDLLELSAAVEAAAYRIVQEALANIIRHARANRVTVCIKTGAELVISVMDDGVGLPKNYEPGVGLLSMRERAEELGGTFDIQSIPKCGTRIEVILPLGKMET